MRFPAMAFAFIAFAQTVCADPVTLEAQDILYAMGAIDDTPNGNFSSTTEKSLASVLGGQYQSVDQNVLNGLYSEFVKKNNVTGEVNWSYKSAEIEVSGYNVQIYDGLKSIADLAESGFNVVTLTFHCDRGQRMEVSSPEYSPLERQFGCELGYNIKDGQSEDALLVYMAEAKKVGLKVNLKPTFLDLTSDVSKSGYKYGKVPVDAFLYGDMPNWDGYVPRINKIAEFAERNGVDYLTIGTEFGNLNPKIMRSKDWVEIIDGIRSRFKGGIMYSHNYGPSGSLKDLKAMKDILSRIDYLGVNFFPSNIDPSADFYTVSEAEKQLMAATVDGASMIDSLARLSKHMNAKIVMSEVSFPTWRGSIKWMFRHSCDQDNKGKAGWEFTKGPLAPKTPSIASSLVLAAAWYNVFSEQPWVYGASHVFWYRTWVDAPTNADFVRKTGTRECGGSIDENSFLRSLISSWYN